MPKPSKEAKEHFTPGTKEVLAPVLRRPLSLLIIALTIGLFTLLASFADDTDFLLRIFKGELPVMLLVVSFKSFLAEFFLTTSLVSLSLLVSVAFLAGVQLSLVAYFMQHRGTLVTEGLFGSGLGTGALLLGLGCVACSSFFLSALFTLGGLTFAIASLPFSGMEFYVLSIAFFLAGIVRTARALKRAAVC